VTKVALIATLGIGGLIGGLSIVEYIEDTIINEGIVAGARKLFPDPMLASQILMTLFGAHLSYKPFRFEGDEIVFDHIAPIEPEPKPTQGYQGAIGRNFIQTRPGQVDFIPRLIGNSTWRADNLSSKIDHIVVVMMENRSYDHVLGYRAQDPINDGADGLTPDMVKAIEQAEGGPFTVKHLRDAAFDKNAIGLMTRLPKGVGHEVENVKEQLSIQTPGPGNRTINSPKGFVEDFKPRLKDDPRKVVPNDVLGFYDDKDLPFFAYLADNYAYCDQYFCSHPGPTLPNRMYSLTGDLQHDRYGFPIVDNNDSDNFLLSRTPTIYDLLVRKGQTFRVYESNPSVTMLRMFARYATDNTNIVPLAQLKADVAPGGRGLPAFTAIEPQMHAHPQNDDHPDADMHRGQIFLKDVYDTLTSNPDLWKRTLLIITYDEHGGLYDHVIPPNADIYNVPNDPVFSENPQSGGSPSLNPSTTLLPIPYGVRVPTFVVSPWTAKGKGPSLTLDHCSILKTVLARFLGSEKPFLSDRVSASNSFDAFLTEAAPRMNVPPSPSLPSLPPDSRRLFGTSMIVTRPLSRQEMRNGPVDYHELTGRWARQLGR
jgi:phospholipase C